MKTLRLFTVAIVLSSTVSTTYSQAVEKGNILIDGYYGFGTITGAIFKVFETGEAQNFNVSVFGPIGGRFEYMVSDKVGVGLDGNYSRFQATYTEEGFDNDSTGNLVSTNYDYTVQNTKIRVMPRVNFHFGSSDKFDGFFAVAAGYYNGKWDYKTNDPNGFGASVNSIVPVTMRLGLGGRYFITDQVNINMELGLFGGAFLHTGIGIKL